MGTGRRTSRRLIDVTRLPDHVLAALREPLFRGGSNEISNILPACRRCNRRKHRKTEEEFRALLQAERAAQLLGSG